MKNHHIKGLMLPVIAVLMVLAGSAYVLKQPPPQSSLTQVRYWHGQWWHWQEAVWAYYNEHVFWPEGLDDVALHYGLPMPAQTIQGFRQGDSFVVRLVGLSASQLDALSAGLGDTAEFIHEDAIQVTLIPPQQVSFAGQKLLRHGEYLQTIDVDIDMQGHHLRNVSEIRSQQLDVLTKVSGQSLTTDTLRGTQLEVLGQLHLDFLYLEDGRDFATAYATINAQYERLAACLQSASGCID